jgi:hypothetical protein
MYIARCSCGQYDSGKTASKLDAEKRWLNHMMGRRQRALKSESSTKRLCACNHNWSSHKDGGKGACNVRAHVPGLGVGNCSCLFYDGPTPGADYTEFLRGSQQ